MKTYGGSGNIVPPLLTSALDGGEWVATRTGPHIHRYSFDRRLGGPALWRREKSVTRRICSSHSGEYEKLYLLGYDSV
jgi:hypothetical protein